MCTATTGVTTPSTAAPATASATPSSSTGTATSFGNPTETDENTLSANPFMQAIMGAQQAQASPKTYSTGTMLPNMNQVLQGAGG